MMDGWRQPIKMSLPLPITLQQRIASNVISSCTTHQVDRHSTALLPVCFFVFDSFGMGERVGLFADDCESR